MAVIEGAHAQCLSDKNDLHPRVRDVVEVAGIVQAKVEAGPVLVAIDEVEAHHSAARCAPAATSRLATEVDVDVGVVPIVNDVTVRVLRVGVHVLVQVGSTGFLGDPEGDRELRVVSVVHVGDLEVVAVAAEGGAVFVDVARGRGVDNGVDGVALVVRGQEHAVSGPVEVVAGEADIERQVSAARRLRLRQRGVALTENALRLLGSEHGIVDPDQCHGATVVAVVGLVGAPAEEDVRLQAERLKRREGRVERARVRHGNVLCLIKTAVEAVLIDGHSDTIIVRDDGAGRDSHDRVYPQVGDSVEVAGVVERVVHHSLAALRVTQPVAHDAAGGCAPAATSLLAREVHVDVSVVPGGRRVSSGVVREQVLVDAIGAVFLGEPEGDREGPVRGRVIKVRDADVIADAVETGTGDTDVGLAVDGNHAAVRAHVGRVAEETDVDLRNLCPRHSYADMLGRILNTQEARWNRFQVKYQSMAVPPAP